MKSTSSFAEIKGYPKHFTSGAILGRMLEGLGFRYYWATENLTEKDLAYNPGNGGRTLHQTLNHIYNMIDFLGYALEGRTYHFPEKDHGFSLSQLRQNTLKRIEDVKRLFVEMPTSELKEKMIHLKVGDNPMEFSPWHLFNGPLIDAIYHLGQVVSFRRSSGNHIDPLVQPFFGKRMEQA